MNSVTVIGLKSLSYPETRALVLLEVNYNNNVYNWEIFCPENKSLDEFLNEETKQKIYADIERKELEWENLSPKTKLVPSFENFGEDNLVEIPIQKEEIVKPDIPDYYAKRREHYPTLGDQLDAIWKGIDSDEFISMVQRIQEVKQNYPKSN